MKSEPVDSPRYSILIASRNEGRLLRRTVEDVAAHSPRYCCEIIAVDDASSDGSAAFLDGWREEGFPAAVLRNRRRRGLIYSRALAASRASGAFLVFLDAHCAVSDEWLASLESELGKIDGCGIAVPVVHALDAEAWKIVPGSLPGSACSIRNPLLDFHWVEPRILDGMLCTCVIGGMAWMCARNWYRRIGELDRGMVGWGGENLDLSLRTWASGGWCVIAPGATVGHLFRQEAPEPIDAVDLLFNKLRAAHTVFSKETLENLLKHFMTCSGFLEALERVRRDRERLSLLKGHLESIRERSDRWLASTFGLPILEPPIFRQQRLEPSGALESGK